MPLPRVGAFVLAGSLLVTAVPSEGGLDLVFANGFLSVDRVCLGDGAGGFACEDVSPGGNQSHDVALGFVDGDRRLDAVFAKRWEEGYRVCLGDGAGGFDCTDFGADTGVGGVALGFVDVDRNLDAVFSGAPNRVCLGDGAGNFTCDNVGSPATNSIEIALGFVDGDRNLDAVFANWGKADSVCLGDGAGGFDCRDVSADSHETLTVALGFVDDDDFLDAVFVRLGPPWLPSILYVCLGNGAGGFECSYGTKVGNCTDVALGFVDGDRNLDAILACLGGGEACLGDGAGGFSCEWVVGTSERCYGVALGFVDDDRNLDAVFARDSFECCGPRDNLVCFGDGAGRFACGEVSSQDSSWGVALGEIRSTWIFADGFESGDTSEWSFGMP